MVSDKPTTICPHCGEEFAYLNDGRIPTHDYPRLCRQVCRGSDQPPKRNADTPLWKDDPEQENRDFFEQIRMEFRLLGFAAVKQIATLSGKSNGITTCPLCLRRVQFSIAKTNGHCAARCETEDCINMME